MADRLGWEVEVIGAERVMAALDPARWSGFGRALLRGGLAVAAEMQRAAKPHHDLGNLERNIHAEGPTGSGLNVEVRVGISTAAAPEGRPLAFGWKSSTGKQPPTEAIAAWLLRKGTVPTMSGPGLLRVPSPNVELTATGATRAARGHTRASISAEAAVRGMAFVIARKIGRRGYSFGSHNWFQMGIDAGRPKLRRIIADALAGRS